MKNYVVRHTRSHYGFRAGEYARGMTPWSNGSTPDLQSAYVYNTRMNRRGAAHDYSPEELAEKGLEIIWLQLVPAAEYESLKEDADWLACLEAAGVDNWPGYDTAREIQREGESE